MTQQGVRSGVEELYQHGRKRIRKDFMRLTGQCDGERRYA